VDKPARQKNQKIDVRSFGLFLRKVCDARFFARAKRKRRGAGATKKEFT
jgi:hypothetical protein